MYCTWADKKHTKRQTRSSSGESFRDEQDYDHRNTEQGVYGAKWHAQPLPAKFLRRGMHIILDQTPPLHCSRSNILQPVLRSGTQLLQAGDGRCWFLWGGVLHVWWLHWNDVEKNTLPWRHPQVWIQLHLPSKQEYASQVIPEMIEAFHFLSVILHQMVNSHKI